MYSTCIHPSINSPRGLTHYVFLLHILTQLHLVFVHRCEGNAPHGQKADVSDTLMNLQDVQYLRLISSHGAERIPLQTLLLYLGHCICLRDSGGGGR